MSVTWGQMRELSVSEVVIANVFKALVIIGVLIGAARGQEINAPQPQHTVEHDPDAWGITTVLTATGVGAFTRPWIGLAAGITVGVASNLQNSRNARQDMVGAVIGSVAGYAIAKTMRHDWKHGRSQ